MGLLSELESGLLAAAVAAVLALLAFNVVLRDAAPRLAKFLSLIVALAVWISAQLYKEFTGEGWDDVARHYVALGTCRAFALCKPEVQSPPATPLAAVASNLQPTEPKPIAHYMIRTPYQGIQFRQNSKTLPILKADDGDYFVVKMRREPFEMLLLDTVWEGKKSDDVALQITVSTDPELFKFAKPDKPRGDAGFFYLGSGMADNQYGSGELISIEKLSDIDLIEEGFAHNYIVGGRFNVASDHARGLFVSSVVERYDNSNLNLFGTRKAIYMVLHLEVNADARLLQKLERPEQPWHFSELELIKLEISD